MFLLIFQVQPSHFTQIINVTQSQIRVSTLVEGSQGRGKSLPGVWPPLICLHWKRLVSDRHARRNALRKLQTSSHFSMHRRYSAPISEMENAEQGDAASSLHLSKQALRRKAVISCSAFTFRWHSSADPPRQKSNGESLHGDSFIHLPLARRGGDVVTNEPESGKKNKNKLREGKGDAFYYIAFLSPCQITHIRGSWEES